MSEVVSLWMSVLPRVTLPAPFVWRTRSYGGKSSTAVGTTLPATSSGPATSRPDAESPSQSRKAMRLALAPTASGETITEAKVAGPSAVSSSN